MQCSIQNHIQATSPPQTHLPNPINFYPRKMDSGESSNSSRDASQFHEQKDEVWLDGYKIGPSKGLQ